MILSAHIGLRQPVSRSRAAFWCGTPLLAAVLLIGGCPPQSGDGTQDPNPNPSTIDAIAQARLATGLLDVSPQDHVLVADGANPLVTVVEYGDLECPICGRFERQTFPTIKQQYIDTGKIRWVFRHFPLRSIHPNAEAAAEASECASDQSQFWGFHDLAYQNQDALEDGDLKRYAGELGLDTGSFNSCVDSKEKAARVQADVTSGTTLGVSGTPTFFINGTSLVGNQSVGSMSALLDAALTAAGG